MLKATKTESGFVHFSDGRRVAYNVTGVTGRSEGWLPITPTHIRLAKKFLESQGILSTNH